MEGKGQKNNAQKSKQKTLSQICHIYVTGLFLRDLVGFGQRSLVI